MEMMNGTRQPHALKASRLIDVLDDQDDGEREEQPERRGDLNEAGVEPSPAIGHVFGDIHRGAAVFPAKREALQHADGQQRDRAR